MCNGSHRSLSSLVASRGRSFLFSISFVPLRLLPQEFRDCGIIIDESRRKRNANRVDKTVGRVNSIQGDLVAVDFVPVEMIRPSSGVGRPVLNEELIVALCKRHRLMALKYHGEALPPFRLVVVKCGSDWRIAGTLAWLIVWVRVPQALFGRRIVL
jgi:DNA-binding transcriptional LysR family regulator